MLCKSIESWFYSNKFSTPFQPLKYFPEGWKIKLAAKISTITKTVTAKTRRRYKNAARRQDH